VTTKTKKLTRPEQHYDLYEVWWDDAAGLRHGWMDRTEKPKAQMVISVGFLIVDESEHIIIAQDTDDTGAHNGRTQIPRGMVKKMRLLRKKTAVKPTPSQPEVPQPKA
jgi:hypothetical protein